MFWRYNLHLMVLCCTLLLLTQVTVLSAQTEVQGVVEQDTWTPEFSPYLVTGDLSIDVLTIEPGVTVKFNGDYRFEINKSLTALGVFSDSIYFRSADDNSAGWPGIHLMPASLESQLAYCKITGANLSGLQADNCQPPQIWNSVFGDNQGNGIDIKGSSVQLNTCTIRDNKYKGIYLEDGQVSAANTIIAGNNEGIYSSLPGDEIELTNSVIAANRIMSIACKVGMATLQNCILYDNDFELSLLDTAHVKASFSNIEQLSTAYPGAGNLSADPGFIDLQSFQLSTESPCIDAGNPQAAFEDVFFPPSAGGVRNDMGAYGGPRAGDWLAPVRTEPKNLDFGKVTLDSTSSLALTLFNNRSQSLNLFQIQLAANAGYFELDTQQLTLPAAGQQTMHIQFTPGKNGLVLSDLVFDIMDQGTVKVPVSGEGIVARISVQNNSISYPVTTVGASSQQYLGLLNLGTDTLRVLRIWSPAAVFFAVDTALNIAPGSGIVQTPIHFSPDAAIAYSDSLFIESNDPGQPRVGIPISGNGQKGPLLTLQPQLVHFNGQPVLTDSVQEVTLTNNGDLELQVLSFGLAAVDTFAGAFDLLNVPQAMPLILQADSSFSLQVRFSPQQRGMDAVWLKIESNSALQSRDSLRIDGQAIAPVAGQDLSVLAFDSVEVGQPRQLTFYLNNNGDAALQIDTVLFRDQPQTLAAFYLAEDLPAFPWIIAPLQELAVAVWFAPQRAGADSARLLISHNDPFSDTLRVDLRGFGIAPELTLSATALDFDGTAYNGYRDRTINLYNSGKRPLLLPADSLVVRGLDSASFSIETELPAEIEIEPGGNQDLAIRFRPQGAGPRNAELHLFSNDPFNPGRVLPLSGWGMDDQPAQVVFDSLQMAPLRSGNAAQLAFAVSSHIQADSIVAYLRTGGSKTFERSRLTFNSGAQRWQLQAPAELITARGVEYYLEVFHGYRKTVFPSSGAVSPAGLAVTTPQMTYPKPTLEGKYQMISIPGSSAGRNISDLFGDLLGAYDKKEYRLFDYPDGENYRELNATDRPLNAGQAVWLVTRDAVHLSVDSIQSVPSIKKYAVPLRRGWNMIANPFAFEISWPVNDSYHSLYFNDGNGWKAVDRMQPFEGYAVYANSDSLLQLEPQEAATMTAKPLMTRQTTDWRVRLSAFSGPLHDAENYAGVAEDVRYNAPEIPPIGAYVSLHFNNVQIADDPNLPMASDYRLPGQEGYAFSFEVVRNSPNPVRISAEDRNLPDDLSWKVICPATQVDHGQAEIIQAVIRQEYVLLVGSHEYIQTRSEAYSQIPVRFALHPAWPNPFNPQTTVRYELPQKQRVALRIYNSLGQMVKQLQPPVPQEAGFYKRTWNGLTEGGNRAASGVYFLQLQAESYTKSIKLVLLK